MMSRVIVIYYSRSGNTKKMAELVGKGVVTAGAECEVKEVGKVKASDLLNYDGIIIGSPTYYGGMASEIKKLLDESVSLHGGLEGRVGGAFSSAANIGGGNETTILDIINAMLIHGMVIQGTHTGDHYGPVSIGHPDSRVEKQCVALGKRVAALVKKLK
ncbi:MAG: flavodoxin domain-containing protein [bacterium]